MSKLSLHVAAAVLCASSAAWAAEPAAPTSRNTGKMLVPRHRERTKPRGPSSRWTARGRSPRGRWSKPPPTSTARVPVPGLVSLATPAFRRAGAEGRPIARAFRRRIRSAMPSGIGARSRSTGRFPPWRRLKVAKAMFGTRVFLNGTLLGDHLPSFTPGYFDAKPALKTGSNEIVIRVGADRDAVGRAYPDGFDFEKERYIPGIFDSVELILSGTPHFISVQAAPDVAGKTVRVQAVLRNDGEAAKAAVTVRRPRGEVRQDCRTVDQRTGRAWPRARRRRWTSASRWKTAGCGRPKTRSSTRSKSAAARTVFARGSACASSSSIRRRAGRCSTASRISCAAATSRSTGSSRTASAESLPWDEKWVRLLHQRVKDMHWNCLRYCIGLPAGGLVRHRRRDRHPHRRRVPDLVRRRRAEGNADRRTGEGICGMDARAMEPSLRRRLGRLQ